MSGCVTARNTGCMPSGTTQAVAARVPNKIAETLRGEADARGLTVSDVVSACIRVALGDERPATGTEPKR